MSNNLIWIFSIVSIVSSILLFISSIRLLKMGREIKRLKIENYILNEEVEFERKIHDWRRQVIGSHNESGTEEDREFIKWVANLPVNKLRDTEDKKSGMNWILWPPKADNIFQDLIEYQKIKESESNKDKK